MSKYVDFKDYLLKDLTERLSKHYLLGDSEEARICECCGTSSPLVAPCCSHTRYVWDGTGENPNRDRLLCPDCAIEYTEEMEDKWNEYYSGIM